MQENNKVTSNNDETLKRVGYIKNSEVLKEKEPINSYNGLNNIKAVNDDGIKKVETIDRSKEVELIVNSINENENLEKFGFDKSKIKTSLLRYMMMYPEEDYAFFGKKIGDTNVELVNENANIDFEYNSKNNVVRFKKSSFENVNEDSIYLQIMLDIFYDGGIKEEHFEAINNGTRELLANSVMGSSTNDINDDLSFQYKYVQYLSTALDINLIINAYKTGDCTDLIIQLINEKFHNANEYASYAMVRRDAETEKNALAEVIKILVSKNIDIDNYIIEGEKPFEIELFLAELANEPKNKSFNVSDLGDFGINHSDYPAKMR